VAVDPSEARSVGAVADKASDLDTPATAWLRHQASEQTEDRREAFQVIDLAS
jgi:hypothetical protein